MSKVHHSERQSAISDCLFSDVKLEKAVGEESRSILPPLMEADSDESESLRKVTTPKQGLLVYSAANDYQHCWEGTCDGLTSCPGGSVQLHSKAVSTRHFSTPGAIDRARFAPSCPCPHGSNWNTRSGF